MPVQPKTQALLLHRLTQRRLLTSPDLLHRPLRKPARFPSSQAHHPLKVIFKLPNNGKSEEGCWQDLRWLELQEIVRLELSCVDIGDDTARLDIWQLVIVAVIL